MQTKSFVRSLVLALVCASGPAFAQEQTPAAEKAEKPAAAAMVGEPAPDFTLTDCHGKKFTLSDLKDKLVVLEWVSQECPFCIKAIPVVKQIQKKYEGKGIVWVGIESTHWRKAEENINFIKEKELAYTILMDADGQVGHLYGAKTTPHIFIINKGKLAYAGALSNDQSGKKKPEEVRGYVDEALAAILGGKGVPVAETTPWGCSVKYAKSGEKGAKADARRRGGDQQEKPEYKEN
jgi:peroxiredoxin